MRICMLTDAWWPIWGGGQVHIQEVAKILERDYHCQADIIAPTLVSKNFKFNNFFHRIWFTFWVLKFLFVSDYDIYHSHSYSTSLFLPLVKFFRKKKIVFTLHGEGQEVVGISSSNVSQNLFRFFSKIVAFFYPYDYLFLIGVKNWKRKKICANRVSELFNGVHVEIFEKIKSNRSEKVFTILYVGRFAQVKNLPVLLYVFQKLEKKNFPFLRLKLVGGNYEEKKLRTMVKELNLENKVEFTGWLSGKDLTSAYKSADLFILSSFASEGFPLTVLEAMAAKLPIIVTDVGDCGMIIREANCGLVVPPRNAKELSKAIIELINKTTKERLEMGNKGLQFVKNNYSWEKVVEKMAEVLGITRKKE